MISVICYKDNANRAKYKIKKQIFLFQLDDVWPASSGVLALEVVLNRVGKDVGSNTASVPTCVLLGSQHYGLATLQAVDAIYHSIEATHLLYLLGIKVEEVLLQGGVGTYAHDNDACLLILIALPEDTLEHVGSCLHNADGAVGWGDEAGLLVVPVLGKVFAKYVGIL